MQGDRDNLISLETLMQDIWQYSDGSGRTGLALDLQSDFHC